MKISSKGRYALASLIFMAQRENLKENVTVAALSQGLGISKIYLEQVFTLLKRSGLVTSVKGAQGGYLLSRPSEEITACEILAATETALFEETQDTVGSTAPGIEKAMQGMLFVPADQALGESLGQVSLRELAEEAQREDTGEGYMYYV
ncbi:MAG: Rrf2 family transcriptional regulator [Clostridiales bacterium]|nr:Rrf2 family transcriptional regulator [Clostridiales bacterium]